MLDVGCGLGGTLAYMAKVLLLGLGRTCTCRTVLYMYIRFVVVLVPELYCLY